MPRTFVFALLLACSLELSAQGTQIPLPPFGSTYSASQTRGFWFQSPVDFIVTGVRVPNEAMEALQHFHLMVMPGMPPNFPSSAPASGLLRDLWMAGEPTGTIVPVNFPVASGEYFGVLGACGSGTMRNSYATGGFASMVGGSPVTLLRFATQNPIDTVASPDYWGVPSGSGSLARVEVYYTQGPSCTINSPMASSMQTGVITIDYDVDHNMMLPVDALFEFSTDAGMSWAAATPSGMSVNPTAGIVTPSTGLLWEWDSLADGIGLIMPQTTELRIEASDAMMQVSTCVVSSLDVDNVVPPPTCMLTQTQPGAASGDTTFDLVPDSMTSMTVDATFEYSLDSGATWSLATPAGMSVNPVAGLPIAALHQFEWDTRADMVGMMAIAPGVLLRATVDSGAPLTGECTTPPFDVDNTALCSTICGDCDTNGAGPDILDALTGAQIAAALIVPTMLQTGCCDVDSSLSVTVLDALAMAQGAAGLPVTLVCP